MPDKEHYVESWDFVFPQRTLLGEHSGETQTRCTRAQTVGGRASHVRHSTPFDSQPTSAARSGALRYLTADDECRKSGEEGPGACTLDKIARPSAELGMRHRACRRQPCKMAAEQEFKEFEVDRDGIRPHADVSDAPLFEHPGQGSTDPAILHVIAEGAH